MEVSQHTGMGVTKVPSNLQIVDIHMGNILLRVASLPQVADRDLATLLGEPEIGPIRDEHPSHLNASHPNYLVPPADVQISSQSLESPEICIADFGEAFEGACKTGKSNTPLSLRAPETFFEDDWDFRIDLWGAGCTVSSKFPRLKSIAGLKVLPDL